MHHNIHLSKTPDEKRELRKIIIERFMQKNQVTQHKKNDIEPEKTAQTTAISSENVFEITDENIDLENRTFHYLEDDPLSGIETDVDISPKYKLLLFLFRIEENFEEPFLQILFVKKEKMYCFPEKMASTPPVDSSSETPLFDQLSLFFENITGETHNDAVNKYKGFIETEDEGGNPCIVGVFGSIQHPETMPIEKQNETPQLHPIWATVDEIFFKNRILDLPIKEYIVKMIYKHPSLMCIKHEDGTPTTIPYLMYLCENDINVFYSEDEEVGEHLKKFSLIHTRKNHDLFRSTYLFSYEPLTFNNLSRIKRYAVIIKNPLYVLNYDFPVTDFKLIDTNRTVCHYERNTEYWSLKNENLFMQI